jgi:hypothetical protein
MFVVPTVSGPWITEEERDRAFALNVCLSQIRQCVEQFKAAVALFEQASPIANSYDHFRSGQGETALQWCLMTGRDGAITLFNRSKLIEAVKGMVGQIASIRPKVDHQKLKLAKKRFDAAFPGVENIRHAVAHAGELVSSPYEMRRNSATKGFTNPNLMAKGTLFLGGSFIEDRFTLTHEGEVFSYSVSTASVRKLESIRDQFFEGFAAFFNAFTPMPPMPKSGG